MEFLGMCIIIIVMCITGYAGFSSFKYEKQSINEKELVVEIQEQGNPTIIDKYIGGNSYKNNYVLVLDFGSGVDRYLEVTQDTYDSYSIGDTYNTSTSE